MIEFAQSLRRLQADEGQATFWTLAASGLVLLAWVAWALFARVSLYEVTSDAHVELEGASYPIEARFAGQVVSTHLHVGADVKKGDLLIELDSTRERLTLQEQQAELTGIEPQLMKLRAQLEAENRIREEERRSAEHSLSEADSRVREAEARAEFAEHERDRAHDLYNKQFVSAREYEKAESDAKQQRLAVDTLKAASRRLPEELAGRDHEGEIRVARLQGEVATLEARQSTLQATTARLRYEIDSREIRAPSDGRVGEAVELRVGAVVAEGARLASIVPEGRLHIVAEYPARAALGRIKPGQQATMRMDGFPWAEFGVVQAAVSAVGVEARDGKVRVELAMSDTRRFRGTLAHGMPGVLEVTVERISPWNLALRAGGRWLTQVR